MRSFEKRFSKDSETEKEIEKININLDEGRHTIHFAPCDLIKNLICSRCLRPEQKEKLSLYQFLSNYVKERLDVIFYLKTLEKIDRIKVLLLNYHQNISLDYIKKPNLRDNNELENLDLDIRKNRVKEANEIIHYYNEKLQKKKSTTL